MISLNKARKYNNYRTEIHVLNKKLNFLRKSLTENDVATILKYTVKFMGIVKFWNPVFLAFMAVVALNFLMPFYVLIMFVVFLIGMNYSATSDKLKGEERRFVFQVLSPRIKFFRRQVRFYFTILKLMVQTDLLCFVTFLVLNCFSEKLKPYLFIFLSLIVFSFIFQTIVLKYEFMLSPFLFGTHRKRERKKLKEHVTSFPELIRIDFKRNNQKREKFYKLMSSLFVLFSIFFIVKFSWIKKRIDIYILQIYYPALICNLYNVLVKVGLGFDYFEKNIVTNFYFIKKFDVLSTLRKTFCGLIFKKTFIICVSLLLPVLPIFGFKISAGIVPILAISFYALQNMNIVSKLNFEDYYSEMIESFSASEFFDDFVIVGSSAYVSSLILLVYVKSGNPIYIYLYIFTYALIIIIYTYLKLRYINAKNNSN